jgi:hypothetical protein
MMPLTIRLPSGLAENLSGSAKVWKGRRLRSDHRIAHNPCSQDTSLAAVVHGGAFAKVGSTMSVDDPSPETLCTQCGASNASGAKTCWLCGRAHVADESPPSDGAITKSPLTDAGGSPFADSVQRHSPQSAMTFRLSSLMLTVTLIAVCLGIGRLSLGLGIALAILVAPAFLRTALAAKRRRNVGQPMGMGDKLAVFIGSLAIMMAISVSSAIAFYATCWAGFIGGAAASESAGAKNYDPIGYGLITGIIVGIVAGIFVAVLMIRWLWPFERKPRAARIR